MEKPWDRFQQEGRTMNSLDFKWLFALFLSGTFFRDIRKLSE